MNDSRTQRTHSGDLTGSPEDYSADTTMGQSSEVLPSGDYAADFNPSRRHVLHLVPVALALMAVLLAAAPSSAGVMADFNGDGFTDLAVAAPFSTNGRGEVIIIFGSPAGLTGTGSLLLVSPRGDNFGDPGEFGRALAAGDFDGDGFADLVVGEPGFDFRPAGFPDFIIDAGAIHIFRGPDFSRQTINDGDRLGQTLAVGDFNGDGRPDPGNWDPLSRRLPSLCPPRRCRRGTGDLLEQREPLGS